MPDDTSTPETAPEIPVEVGEVNPEPPPPASDIPAPTPDDKIAALEKDKKELNDRFLRTAADFDNYRKRARKDVDDARGKAREDVLREMLPVVDNLERALAAADTAGGASGGIADGVKLVLRQFGSALDRFEVKTFPTVGQSFDPARHEAIAQVESVDHSPGTVVNEMQKGYLIGTKLLRPAMVTVAKAPPQTEPPRARQTIPPTAPAEAPTLTGLPDDDEEGFAGPDEKTKAGATIPPGNKAKE